MEWNMYDKEILNYVKEHSPKSFAKKIERRCQKTIDKMKELLDTPDDAIPRLVKINNGCPHCKRDCKKCLWTQAAEKCGYFDDYDGYGDRSEVCTNIYFGYSSWAQVYSMVKLCPKHVEIYPWSCGIDKFCQLTEKLDLYKSAIDFLQGHIDWAREDGWGKHYKA